jgi:transposase
MDGEPTTLEQDGPLRSGHKGSHMTAATHRIEVITRGERRRRWSIEEKREIVAASLRPDVRPSEIIQRHGITSGQLYAWRQQLTRRIGGELAQSAPSFARVAVDPGERNMPPVTEVPRPPLARRSAQEALPAVSRTRGLIEIVLPGGTSVRVDAHVDDRALRCVLGALREP